MISSQSFFLFTCNFKSVNTYLKKKALLCHCEVKLSILLLLRKILFSPYCWGVSISFKNLLDHSQIKILVYLWPRRFNVIRSSISRKVWSSFFQILILFFIIHHTKPKIGKRFLNVHLFVLLYLNFVIKNSII